MIIGHDVDGVHAHAHFLIAFRCSVNRNLVHVITLAPADRKSPLRAFRISRYAVMDRQCRLTSASKDPVAGKTIADILGEIVWLMTQDPSSKDMSVSDIERFVMPAIMLKQFHLEYVSTAPAPKKQNQNLMPVKATIFALCSEADAGLVRTNPLTEIRAGRWKSGGIKTLIIQFSLRKSI